MLVNNIQLLSYIALINTSPFLSSGKGNFNTFPSNNVSAEGKFLGKLSLKKYKEVFDNITSWPIYTNLSSLFNLSNSGLLWISKSSESSFEPNHSPAE